MAEVEENLHQEQPCLPVVFGRDEIKRLFKQLDQALKAQGDVVWIYVVGGANIALVIDGSRSTSDIDVVVRRGMDALARAAATVAKSNPGLQADWINTEFTGNTYDGGITWSWFDNQHLDEPETFYESDNLKVELASTLMLLALKALDTRPQGRADLYNLMRLTGLRTKQEVGANLRRFTGDRLFESQGKPGTFVHVFQALNEAFEELPQDLRPPEKDSLFRRIIARTRK